MNSGEELFGWDPRVADPDPIRKSYDGGSDRVQYTPEMIEETLSLVDLVDIISGYADLKQRGSRWVANCPFHDEKQPSFNVSQEDGYYICFGCGKKGNAIHFLREKENLSFIGALHHLRRLAGLPILSTHDFVEEWADSTSRLCLKESGKVHDESETKRERQSRMEAEETLYRMSELCRGILREEPELIDEIEAQIFRPTDEAYWDERYEDVDEIVGEIHKTIKRIRRENKDD